jgi:hypothetical protein
MPVHALVPMAHVASVPRAAAFYALLGFDVRNSVTPPGVPEPVWAWLVSGDAQLMVTKADGPVDHAVQAVLFYLYCDDVAALREQLLAARVAAGPISRPFYSPRGEFRLTDPDGYVLMIANR